MVPDLTDQNEESFTYDEQVRIIMPRIHLAQTHTMVLTNDSRTFALIEPRLQAGFHEFGSRLFNKQYDELVQDAREELADALIYLAAARWKGLAR